MAKANHDDYTGAERRVVPEGGYSILELTIMIESLIGKLDTFIDNHTERHVEQRNICQDHQKGQQDMAKRITALEQWRWGLAGGIAVLVVEVPLVLFVLQYFVRGH